jgi:hypothetical protein
MLGGSTRLMKRVIFLICGVCWFMFGLGLGFIALEYLTDGAGLHDIGPSLPIFGPAVGLVHLVGIFISAMFCFIVGLVLCFCGIMTQRGHQKRLR